MQSSSTELGSPGVSEWPAGAPEPECLAAYRRQLIESGKSPGTIRSELAVVRVCQRFLRDHGYPVRTLNDKVMRDFRDDRLKRGSRRKPTRRKSQVAQELAIFKRWVLFLEETGRVDHPGETALAQELLEAFVTDRARLGYGHHWLKKARWYVGHFLGWLHMSRVPIRVIGRQTVEDFCLHDCVCRGNTRHGRPKTRPEQASRYVAPFVSFLAERGIIAREQDVDAGADEPAVLVEFASWLREQRGICEATIRNHERRILRVFSRLGWDPSQYDAAGIRRALERAFSQVSHTHALHLAVSTRTYLRFLAATGVCRAALVKVVPKARRPALAELPRYISEEETQRVIDACDSETATGLRDRAMLLLMTQLGLRVGDVAALCMDDIDWDRGRIVVCGKSRREVLLPLPQEAGDAILQYLEHGRPRVSHAEVFLRSNAPHTPFARSGTVSTVVLRALQRAGVESPGGRGGHVLRHSFATHTLRAGGSLEVVGTVLRHDSPRTTAVYAKVDLPALQVIAQPWIGAGEGA